MGDAWAGAATPAQATFCCYFLLGARCESADAAAVFDALPLRPSRSTFEAARAAAAEVFLCFATGSSEERSTIPHARRTLA